jgi:hypothetical protein
MGRLLRDLAGENEQWGEEEAGEQTSRYESELEDEKRSWQAVDLDEGCAEDGDLRSRWRAGPVSMPSEAF